MALRSWRGKEIALRAEVASRVAIDATMAACVRDAKQTHTFVNRTGTLQNSIRIVDFAARHGLNIQGRWGSQAVAYAIYIELGTSRMAAQPYLRPAADRHYPDLSRLVREAFRSGGLP